MPLDQLRGSWEVSSWEDSESNQEEFGPSVNRLTFDGDKLTIVFWDRDDEKGTIKIDTAGKPAKIDIIVDGEESLGIYEVRGDSIRICFSPQSKRPWEFKSGEDIIIVTLKRVTKK